MKEHYPMHFYPPTHLEFSYPPPGYIHGRNGYTRAATADMWTTTEGTVHLDLYSTHPGRHPTASLCLPAKDMLALANALHAIALTIPTPPNEGATDAPTASA